MNATSVKSCRSKKAIPQGTGTFSRQSQHIRFISMKNRLVPHQESSRDSRKFPLRVGGRSPQGVFQVSGSNCAQLVAHHTQIFFHRSSPKMVISMVFFPWIHIHLQFGEVLKSGELSPKNVPCSSAWFQSLCLGLIMEATQNRNRMSETWNPCCC